MRDPVVAILPLFKSGYVFSKVYRLTGQTGGSFHLQRTIPRVANWQRAGV